MPKIESPKTGRGYFGIGVYHPKTQENIGTLWRHAYLYGADFLFTIGRRYRKQASDTSNTTLHIPIYNYKDYQDFVDHIPYNCPIVCIELTENAQSLPSVHHPERAIYLLGAEDHGLPSEILEDKQIIQIPAPRPQSMNVATSGTLIMYDRFIKRSYMSRHIAHNGWYHA